MRIFLILLGLGIYIIGTRKAAKNEICGQCIFLIGRFGTGLHHGTIGTIGTMGYITKAF
jgi:hypothetical protein